METIDEIYLECINDYSCKFYLLRLVAEEDGTFSVRSRYGLLGTIGYQHASAEHVTEDVARKAYEALIRQKTARHGYILGKQPEYLA